MNTSSKSNVNSKSSFALWFVVGVILLNLSVLFLTVISLKQSFDQTEIIARITADNLSSLLEEDISNSFFRIDLALQSTADEAKRQLSRGPINKDQINSFISRLAKRLPKLSHLRLTDAEGNLLYGTGIRPEKKINVSKRDFFSIHRDNVDSGLIVSKPLISYTSGKWQLILTRRVTMDDRSFGGMVPALVELEKITEMFSLIDIGKYGVISIYDKDLNTVVHYSNKSKLEEKELTGKKNASIEFMTALKQNPNFGQFGEVSPLDSRDRVFAYKKLDKFPFYILVGLAGKDYLEQWHKQLFKGIVSLILFALVTSCFCYLIIRAWNHIKRAEEHSKFLAFHDALTKLPNRRLMVEILDHAVLSAKRSGRFGILQFIDLDNFKIINDTLGHDVGDDFLKEVAKRLTGGVRETDLVARLGGDEFVIIQENLSGKKSDALNQAKILGEKVVGLLNKPYMLDGSEHHSSPSIGIALFNGDSTSVADLLKEADLAMYNAKSEGKNTLRFFDKNMQLFVQQREEMVSDLREGIRQEQFELYLQPQVGIDGSIIGAEALLRWSHPEKGEILPGVFIPFAEEAGLIIDLGNWVIEAACRQLAKWAENPRTKHLSISINISVKQLHHNNFVDQVLSAVEVNGAAYNLLTLELTESFLIKDVSNTISKMVALNEKGICFSIDDFGTGYSSLNYLNKLPLEQLKIDRSFISDANQSPIVSMIIALGQSMNLSVIAEGVETEAQLASLKQLGCQYFQGYFFSKPIPSKYFRV